MVLQDLAALPCDVSQHPSLAFVRGGTVLMLCREKAAGLLSLRASKQHPLLGPVVLAIPRLHSCL